MTSSRSDQGKEAATSPPIWWARSRTICPMGFASPSGFSTAGRARLATGEGAAGGRGPRAPPPRGGVAPFEPPPPAAPARSRDEARSHRHRPGRGGARSALLRRWGRAQAPARREGARLPVAGAPRADRCSRRERSDTARRDDRTEVRGGAGPDADPSPGDFATRQTPGRYEESG